MISLCDIFQADKITVPHGERVTGRCRELGRYKLQGDPVLHCRNGAWNGKPPSCIPTTAISNYTGAYITVIIIMFQLLLLLCQGHVTNPTSPRHTVSALRSSSLAAFSLREYGVHLVFRLSLG